MWVIADKLIAKLQIRAQKIPANNLYMAFTGK